MNKTGQRKTFPSTKGPSIFSKYLRYHNGEPVKLWKLRAFVLQYCPLLPGIFASEQKNKGNHTEKDTKES